ncbi:myoD family inhibitor domain-containing protein-like [Brachyistius frenatus]|uniref:myoD family inhibitor domain-containing protein-like n=1 Tax=Brachyistius frenatus TaxID=100188 RepID=UPI0037E93EC8
MLPGERLAVDGREKHSNQTEGQEILSACDPVNGGNTTPADIISSKWTPRDLDTQPQPQPAAAPPAEASRQAAVLQKPQRDLGEPACPRRGLAAPDPRRPPLSPAPSRVQGSRSSVHNGGGKRSRRSRSRVAGSHRTAATPADACFHVLLACLSCRWSAMLLGVLEACSSCLRGPCSSCLRGGPCSSCLRACARCCSAVQEAPVEELDCHARCRARCRATLVESCCDCETGECLEFCLECCDLCHRS